MKFKNFYDLLNFNAKNYGENIALKYEFQNHICEITYQKLFEEILIQTEKFKKDSNNCYGIFETGKSFVIDFFASVLAGKQTVLIDSSIDDNTLQKLVTYADVNKLCVDENTKDVLDSIKISDTKIEKFACEGDILFFTSGTTGLSKAVVLTSSNLCASAYNGQDKLPCLKNDILLSILPFSHVFGFVCALLWPMNIGATVALGRGLRHLAEDCNYFKPTVISVVPTILYFLLSKNALNPELRVILVGAGPANEKALIAAKTKGYDVHFGYGLTETSSGVAISTGNNPFLMEVCCEDVVTLASDGEILVKSPNCMMKGYYKFPNKTNEVLENGILKTGDLGVFENNCLKIIGRKKDILVLENGTKIYLPEWEAELKEILGIDELAIVMRNGVVTAICVDEKNNYSDLNAKLIEFNQIKPFDKQVSKIEKRNNPLPKTAIGKIKRWKL